jgi:aspartate aminotransferase
MTVGATGALDVILKTLLCPERGDGEVLVVAPYFLEYLNLVRSNGGVPVVVPSTADFGLDTAAIADAITPRTRAIIVNSPNNPTGKIYSEDSLRELSRVLEAKNRELDLCIAVIEDAVYDSIVFTGRPTPSMIPHYPAMFRVNSYSKSLGLAGERLGHLAVHPGFAPEARKRGLIDSLKLNMRMRVVHAPLLQHRVVARLPLHGLTDVEAYRRNVERLHLTLSTLGFGVMRPEGTFYLWASLPPCFSSEREFQRIAHGGPAPLLYLPGVLFGGDAYSRCVRFSACVPLPEVERACARLHEISSIHTSRPGRPL